MILVRGTLSTYIVDRCATYFAGGGNIDAKVVGLKGDLGHFAVVDSRSIIIGVDTNSS
jgi:hypothetical protein